MAERMKESKAAAERLKESKGPVGGMSLATRFTLFMTLSLTIVMTVAGFALYTNVAKLATSVQENTLVEAVRLTGLTQQNKAELKRVTTERDLLLWIDNRVASNYQANLEFTRLRNELKAMAAERGASVGELELSITFGPIEGKEVKEFADGQVKRYEIEFGPGKERAFLMRFSPPSKAPDFDLLVPATTVNTERGLLGVIIGTVVAVIAVAALISMFISAQVSGPIEAITDDIRQISWGNLTHTTQAKGVREVKFLARSIDRMTADLSAAQVARLELSVREREVALAAEVRASLLANATPVQDGYEFAALSMSAANLGGDFHDFISTPGGGVGLLVCDVSGRGLPGTLVGATARAYLRAELSRGEDLREALFHVNRELSRDVRRGMYVSAMYMLLDPKTHGVRIACAGHKLPLVHFVAATGKVALVQPEGIALGFDPGPIFESRLEIAELHLEPGDRLAIFNSGPAALVNAAGEEFGEKHIYAQVQRHGARASDEFIERLKSVLEAYAGKTPLERDISILTARRR